MAELIVLRPPGPVDYLSAWDWQRRLHARRAAGDIADSCLLLEHQPVYTAGRRAEPWEMPTDGTPVVPVDRGGRVTWHGPGQLVGYPILRLPPLVTRRPAWPGRLADGTGPVDVVGHVRRLEEVLIRTCAQVGVPAERVTGRSGVWVRDASDRKLAAVGVRVARGVSMHGFALNCDCDLRAFRRIVPCGITDAGVTSLSREAGRRVAVGDVLAHLQQQLAAVFGLAARGGSLAELLGEPCEPVLAVAGV